MSPDRDRLPADIALLADAGADLNASLTAALTVLAGPRRGAHRHRVRGPAAAGARGRHRAGARRAACAGVALAPDHSWPGHQRGMCRAARAARRFTSARAALRGTSRKLASSGWSRRAWNGPGSRSTSMSPPMWACCARGRGALCLPRLGRAYVVEGDRQVAARRAAPRNWPASRPARAAGPGRRLSSSSSEIASSAFARCTPRQKCGMPPKLTRRCAWRARSKRSGSRTARRPATRSARRTAPRSPAGSAPPPISRTGLGVARQERHRAIEAHAFLHRLADQGGIGEQARVQRAHRSAPRSSCCPR